MLQSYKLLKVGIEMANNNTVKIGNSLKRFRKAFNLTQEEVARSIGILRPIYTKYEGDKNMPGVDIIFRLADAYGVTTDYLLGRSDEPHPPKLDKETLNLIEALQVWKDSKSTKERKCQ